MGARATRPPTGRGARRGGWTFGAHMETDFAQSERDAAAGAERARATVLERVEHPVVTPPRRGFRVIRLFLLQGHLSIEDIGQPANAAEAMAISTTERWRAQVLDPEGKVYADNWRQMERRA